MHVEKFDLGSNYIYCAFWSWSTLSTTDHLKLIYIINKLKWAWLSEGKQHAFYAYPAVGDRWLKLRLVHSKISLYIIIYVF